VITKPTACIIVTSGGGSILFVVLKNGGKQCWVFFQVTSLLVLSSSISVF